MCFLKVNTETFEGVLKVHLRYQQLQYTKVLEKSRLRVRVVSHDQAIDILASHSLAESNLGRK